MDEKQIKELYQKWCKDTNRSGGVLVGSSIKELLIDLMNQAYHIGHSEGYSEGDANGYQEALLNGNNDPGDY